MPTKSVGQSEHSWAEDVHRHTAHGHQSTPPLTLATLHTKSTLCPAALLHHDDYCRPLYSGSLSAIANSVLNGTRLPR